MRFRKAFAAATPFVISLAAAGSVQAHSGADTGGLAAVIHPWLHAASPGGLVLAGVALAGIILIRRTRASRR